MFTIAPRAIEVTADAASKAYGDADPTLSFHITSGALAGGETITGAVERAAGEHVGNNYGINQGTLAVSGNHELTFVPATFTITPRAVEVTADAQHKVYDDADPTLSYKVTGGALLSGDSFTGSLKREEGENVGSYPIQQGNLALGSDYALTFVPATLTIAPRAVEVTADATSKVYGDVDPALSYEVTGGALVGTDSFTGSLARVAGEHAGNYAIQQGTLALSNNYTLNFKEAQFSIELRPVAVAADPQTKVFGTSDPSLTYQVTAGTPVNGDAFTGGLVREAGENVGSYAITQGTLSLSGDYQLSFSGAILTVTAAPTATPTSTPTTVPSAPSGTDGSSGSGGSGSGGSHGSGGAGSSGGSHNVGGGVGSGSGSASAGQTGQTSAPAGVPAAVATPSTDLGETDVTEVDDTAGSVPIGAAVPASQPALEPVSGLVDPLQGGVLQTPDGRLTIELPAGASEDVLWLSVAPGAAGDSGAMDVQPTTCFVLGGTAVQLTGSDSVGQPVTLLQQPFTLTLEPDVADVQAAGGQLNRLVPGVFDAGRRMWLPLATQVTLDGQLSATSRQLGTLAVLHRTACGEVTLVADAALRSGADDTAPAFGIAPAGSRFRVLDMLGTYYLVQDADGNLAWVEASSAAVVLPAADQPPTSDATSRPPASDVANQPPTGDVASDPPTGDVASQPPTSDAASRPPASDVANQPPTSDVVSHPPTGDVASQPPTSDAASRPPTGDVANQSPASDTSSQPPTSDPGSQSALPDQPAAALTRGVEAGLGAAEEFTN
jgi:hypothetical protein